MTADAIYLFCLEEMYELCREHSIPDAWVYLYTSWYSPDSWRNWARSSAPTAIPLSNTTMLIEAHWKVLKRNHLYHFNRAHLDLLVFIIMERHCRDLVIKFDNFVVHRHEPSSWERNFTLEWRKALNASNEHPATNARYHPSIDNWVCGCQAYFNNQYLICKHLVRRSRYNVDGIHYHRHVVLRRTTAPFITIRNVSICFINACHLIGLLH